MTIDTEKQDRTESTELAAGWYWVGDPCYAFSGQPHDVWMEWLDDAWRDIDANRAHILDGRVRGALVAAASTKWGDGTYSDQDGNHYGVDAGLLGAVHADHWFLAPEFRAAYESAEGDDEREGRIVHDMRLTHFPEPFRVRYQDHEGLVSVGHVEIATDWVGDEDEEYED